VSAARHTAEIPRPRLPLATNQRVSRQSYE
jgi:hypothetical protein